ncbi:NTP/NDP exchange transporter [Bordetella flabilis]|uniref:ADP/ATP translocating protein n=1 Tax=Bordetella flabilis TaxID=463014 RepID=A0A193GHN0_9BORD|nr:MFS transporter [Bordetella flabilis]ANN78789.1 ADP/ATP translocating protein [Bordetella flabilis]
MADTPPLATPSRLSIEGLRRALNIQPGEGLAALCGFGFFFCLFTGYFTLRPIRETLGIAAGVDKLQWLFTATFLVMLAAVPCFGWLARRVPRASFVTWAYAFFAATLVGFSAWLHQQPGNAWGARAFYVWLSVFNLFVVSVAWSLMADVFRTGQAKRLFAFIAAGASTGGLAGPVLGAALAGVLGTSGLILLSAILLGLTLPLKSWLMRWRAHSGAGAPDRGAEADTDAPGADSPGRPIGGGILAGATRTFTSPLLLGVAAFVILLATASTFLYMEQARLVADTFTSSTERIRVFSALDFTVQALSMLAQLFLTGRLAQRFGVTFLLTSVPVVICAGFLVLAVAPTFAVLAVVMVLRRVGEYALVRPGREMVFTTVDAEAKYKAKNFIDTVVYRAGDAASAWVKTGVDALGHGVGLVALVGAVCAMLWAACGYALGRRTDARRPRHA